MVIDAAKGIEPRTLKLFEVCRLRDIPIITFINKMDRESAHPFEILDEVRTEAGARLRAFTWPIGRARALPGLSTCAKARSGGSTIRPTELTPVNGPEDPKVAGLCNENEREARSSRMTGFGGMQAVRRRCLQRRPSDAGLFGSALREFRRARPDRRARRHRAAAAGQEADTRRWRPSEPAR
jgi:peptide chain release factor 3